MKGEKRCGRGRLQDAFQFSKLCERQPIRKWYKFNNWEGFIRSGGEGGGRSSGGGGLLFGKLKTSMENGGMVNFKFHSRFRKNEGGKDT